LYSHRWHVQCMHDSPSGANSQSYRERRVRSARQALSRLDLSWSSVFGRVFTFLTVTSAASSSLIAHHPYACAGIEPPLP
jgi:hypothetical protein